MFGDYQKSLIILHIYYEHKRHLTNFCSNETFWGDFQTLHIVWKLLKFVTFEFLNFGIFRQFLSYFKLTCLATLFDRKLQDFKNSLKRTSFGIFDYFLSTKNVKVARFARNVELDYFCDFQTLCTVLISFKIWISIFCC